MDKKEMKVEIKFKIYPNRNYRWLYDELRGNEDTLDDDEEVRITMSRGMWRHIEKHGHPKYPSYTQWRKEHREVSYTLHMSDELFLFLIDWFYGDKAGNIQYLMKRNRKKNTEPLCLNLKKGFLAKSPRIQLKKYQDERGYEPEVLLFPERAKGMLKEITKVPDVPVDIIKMLDSFISNARPTELKKDYAGKYYLEFKLKY